MKKPREAIVLTDIPEPPLKHGDRLIVNAASNHGAVQGHRHRDLPLHGVRFPPESVASEDGHDLLRSFVELAKQAQR